MCTMYIIGLHLAITADVYNIGLHLAITADVHNVVQGPQLSVSRIVQLVEQLAIS